MHQEQLGKVIVLINCGADLTLPVTKPTATRPEDGKLVYRLGVGVTSLIVVSTELLLAIGTEPRPGGKDLSL